MCVDVGLVEDANDFWNIKEYISPDTETNKMSRLISISTYKHCIIILYDSWFVYELHWNVCLCVLFSICWLLSPKNFQQIFPDTFGSFRVYTVVMEICLQWRERQTMENTNTQATRVGYIISTLAIIYIHFPNVYDARLLFVPIEQVLDVSVITYYFHCFFFCVCCLFSCRSFLLSHYKSVCSFTIFSFLFSFGFINEISYIVSLHAGTVWSDIMRFTFADHFLCFTYSCPIEFDLFAGKCVFSFNSSFCSQFSGRVCVICISSNSVYLIFPLLPSRYLYSLLSFHICIT